MPKNMFRNRDKCDAYCDDSPCDLKFLKEIYGDCYHKSDASRIRCGDNFCDKDYDCMKSRNTINYVDKGNNNQLTFKDTYVSYSKQNEQIILAENPMDGQYISINLSKKSGKNGSNEIYLSTYDGSRIKTKINEESKPTVMYLTKDSRESMPTMSVKQPGVGTYYESTLKHKNTISLYCDNIWSFIYFTNGNVWREV